MSIFGGKKPAAPAEKQTQTADERLEAMGKAITGMEELVRSVATQNQRLNGLITSLVATGRPAPVEQVPATSGAPGVNMVGLPNPADDMDGFLKGLDARINAAMTGTLSGITKAIEADRAGANERKSFYDDLSEQFDSKYQDLVDQDELVTAQAAKVVKRLASRGVDPEKYIAIDPDGFMQQVAEGARAAIVAAGQADDDEIDQESAQDAHDKAARAFAPDLGEVANEDVDEGRASVLGGDQTNIVPATKGEKPKAATEGLLSGLTAWQKDKKII